MAMCSEAQIGNDSCPLVLEAANFQEAFESRVEWLSNQGFSPQSPAKIGIVHEEITGLELVFPAVLAYQTDPSKKKEKLELWVTPSHLYRNPNAPHYSLNQSLQELVTDGNPFRACTGLRVRRSYVFVDQGHNRNLLVNSNMFEFRAPEVLEYFMDRYHICRLFVNPDEHNIMGDFPMTCITQREFWEARTKSELAAVAKQYGICDPSDLLGFVSFARGLMDSNDFTTLEQVAIMVKNKEDGYI